jgi:hypothetical protein
MDLLIPAFQGEGYYTDGEFFSFEFNYIFLELKDTH